jgi:peptide/nickel transport system permease protein
VTAYLLRRGVFALFLVFAVSSGALVLARLAPGDYAVGSLGIAGESDRDALRRRYGLDRPIVEQYGEWLAGAVRLNFGRSLTYDRPVTDLIPERAGNTALLALTALTLATVIGVPLGVLTATSGGAFPAIVRAVSVLLLSMPPLLTSVFLLFLAARSGWLPIAGMRSADAPAGVAAVWDLAAHMVVPVIALALPLLARFERLQSQAMEDVIHEPFVAAAIARGVPRHRIVWRSALRNALAPIVAVYGVVVGSLLSGSFVVEIVTAWPGLGRLMLDALRARDVYLVAGCAAAGAAFLAVGTFLSDAAHALADPRVSE